MRGHGFGILTATLMMFAAQYSAAEDHIIAQKNKAFSQPEITIKVGDTIEFRNDDDFFHNVFSLSDIQFFDLGSYPTGQSKPVKFETPGTVDVECAIHPEMQMKVHVQP